MIYFITQQDKYVKIGYTKAKPLKRLVSLQIGNPFKLTLWGCIPGEKDAEARLHQAFDISRVRGEWYALTPDIVKYMHEVESLRVCITDAEYEYIAQQHGLLDRLRLTSGCVDSETHKWLV